MITSSTWGPRWTSHPECCRKVPTASWGALNPWGQALDEKHQSMIWPQFSRPGRWRTLATIHWKWQQLSILFNIPGPASVIFFFLIEKIYPVFFSILENMRYFLFGKYEAYFQNFQYMIYTKIFKFDQNYPWFGYTRQIQEYAIRWDTSTPVDQMAF